VFRNEGIKISDAGESPKIKHTTCFNLSALSPENFLAFHSASCNIPYKTPTET